MEVVPPEACQPDYFPRRIVSLQPSATVILHAIGELHRLVACTKYCLDVCSEAAHGRTIVDDSWTAKTDEIVAVQPDLVIASVPYQEKAVGEILKSGARFLGFAPHTLADIYTDIITIAGAVGAADRGAQVIATMQREIERVQALTAKLPRPRVFCEEWGKPVIASQAWVAELVEAAGGIFQGEPGKQIDENAVLALDPQVFIAAWCGAGDRVPLLKITRNRGWHEMEAVRGQRVYCIRDEFLNTPAPTLLRGLHALAAAIHPESFPPASGVRRITDATRDSHTENSTLV
jgi:iron complex transport system substrate-binding protein